MDISPLRAPGQISESLRYRDVSRLGEGGFSEVYRAFDPQLCRFVALKLLVVQKPEYVERMFREARAQAKVRHEGICQIYEVGWLGTHPFIAMQLIEGVELRQLIPTLSLDQKLDVAQKVCAALQAAHDRGLIHRDIKPANIMVERCDDELRPYVVDFGLVLERNDPRLTGSGSILGTPSYMAPEQVRGEHRGARSDVYGLGATFYELFTEAPPFREDSPGLTYGKVLEEEPIAANERNPEVSRDLAAVLARAMAKDPEHRYADSESFGEDLSRARRGEPVEAALPSPVQRLWWSFSSHRISTRLSVAAFLLLALIAAGLQWRSHLKLKYQAHYATVARDIEDGYRSVLMSPSHDLSSDISALRRRLGTLEQDLAQRGFLAAGPIHFALGKGHDQLGATELATEHFEKAWHLGFQEPTVAMALGRAHAELYRDQRWDLGSASTPALKQALDQLKSRHRDPAVEYLRLARRARSAPAGEIEVQLAWVEEQFDEALIQIREVRRQAPWRHEPLILEAGILEDQAFQLSWAGRRQDAMERLDLAGELLVRARKQAPSDPDVVLQLCQLMGRRLKLLVEDGVTVSTDEMAPFYRAGLEACSAAADLNRRLGETWILLSDLHIYWGNALTHPNDDAVEIFEKAVSTARRAVDLSPQDSKYRLRLAEAIGMKLQHDLNYDRRDSDLLPEFEEATGLLERLVEDRPDYADAWNWLGALLDYEALYLLCNGRDGLPVPHRSADALERAIDLDSESYCPHYNLSISYYRLAWGSGLLPASADLTPVDWNRRGTERILEALELRPNSGWAHNMLGSLLIQEGDWAWIEDLSPVDSWARGFEHLLTAIHLAPEDPAFVDSLAEELLVTAERLLGRGHDNGLYLDALETVIEERGNVLNPDELALHRLNLDKVRVLNRLLMGQPVDLFALNRRSTAVSDELSPGDPIRRELEFERLFYAAIHTASQGERLSTHLVEDLKRSIGRLKPKGDWLLGLTAILQAYAAADPSSRRAALEDAAHWLHSDRLPQYQRKHVEAWLDAAGRLPESGVVRFQLFDRLLPWDEPPIDPARFAAPPPGESFPLQSIDPR